MKFPNMGTTLSFMHRVRSKDNVFGLFPRFAEISFSLFYYVTDNFILARLIRFLIFIGCLIIFYITCLVFCKSKKFQY